MPGLRPNLELRFWVALRLVRVGVKVMAGVTKKLRFGDPWGS